MTNRAFGPEFGLIADIATRIAAGELTAQALLAACLANIEAHDRQGAALHAMLALNPAAMDDAQALDAERAKRGVRGPLHGVPMVVKDNIDVAGLPTTSGCLALAGAMPHGDAGQVRRLRSAGAVIVGKTNLSEFSFEIRSRSSLGGDVLNPFDRKVTAGGSSGGAAAAIAAGFAVAGLGSDTGGSIRTPAAYTGLVGLRPTQGLLDRSGVAPLAPSVDVVAPMARAVGDLATLLTVMGDGSFPTVSRGGLLGARIGVLRRAFGSDPEVQAAMDAGLRALAKGGATLVDPVGIPEALWPEGRDSVVDWEFRPAFDAYLAANFAPGSAPASLAAIQGSGDHLADHTEALDRRAAAGSLDHPKYRAILAYHAELRDTLAALVQAHALDAMVYPTSAVVPDSLENPKGGWAPEIAACSGWPALSLPAGRSQRGVPIGLELLAPAFQETRLLALGADLERRLGLRYRPELD